MLCLELSDIGAKPLKIGQQSVVGIKVRGSFPEMTNEWDSNERGYSDRGGQNQRCKDGSK